jgi:tetratricopeptide (TPR) repeat protein
MKRNLGLLLLCSFSSFLFLASAFSGGALADDDQSHHHPEDLTVAQLGTVSFPVSCAPTVQKPFERGVALLHSFWYEEAEKEFEEIAKNHPGCAMAHWGIAMSLWHQLWNHPDAKLIDRGNTEVGKALRLNLDKRDSLSKIPAGVLPCPPPSQLSQNMTAREFAYIDAIAHFYNKSPKLDHEARAKAYSAAMKKVYESYPDDHEAAVFYALSLLASEPHQDTTFANRKQAAAILEKLFATEPDHPGVAHYLIHSYDKPQLAQLGLPAARRYAQVAPAAPHALHMPSHIFARVGLWQDDISSNLASIAATRKTAAMHMGGEGHQFHAMDFLIYAYLQSGREADAARQIDEVTTMPKMKSMYGSDFDPQANALTKFPAIYDLELRHWSEAAALEVVPGSLRGDQSITHWARAIGAARSGNVAAARKDLKEIEAIRKEFVAEKKMEYAEAVVADYQEAAAWVAHAEGNDDEAITSLRALADKSDKLGEEPEGIPAREQLADLLLEAKRPQQALAEYQTDLQLNPNRFNALYGAARAAEAAGQQKAAAEYYALLLKVCDGSNSTRPELSRARELVAQK